MSTRVLLILVVSYLLILPLALVGVLVWNELRALGPARLVFLVTIVPIVCVSLCALMWADTCRRLLYPPDLGSEGKEVVDLDSEAQEAVGLYIKRDEFPDKLFAPPKRTVKFDNLFGKLNNYVLGPFFDLLPERVRRPLGWHIMIRANK